MIGTEDAGKLGDTQSQGGMPEPIGGRASGNRPHAASWQLLLEDAATADLARPAGEPQCLQLAPSAPAQGGCAASQSADRHTGYSAG